ncbi:hypothetical protein P9139_02645 [Curtobacterium flaccumfaciens]|nr:hypothetical protein P9139_02645 [Curtobacterium flaccumfaciens]
MSYDQDRIEFPNGPRTALERTIGELVDRAQEVLATQGRLRGLLRANRLVVEELDLTAVLRRIVEAAVELVGARYGAMGVLARTAPSSSSCTSACPRRRSVRSATCPVAAGCSARSSPPRTRCASTTSVTTHGPRGSPRTTRRWTRSSGCRSGSGRTLRQPVPHA